MKIKLSDGREFKVGFRYQDIKKRRRSPINKIEAYLEDDQQRKFSTTITRYYADANNRVVGRKIALEHVLQEAFPAEQGGKETRLKVWEALKARKMRGLEQVSINKEG